MTTSTQQPASPQQRKPLNDNQLNILQLLYRFRFATIDLITEYLNKNDRTGIYKRLKGLCDQEYIGRNFKASNYQGGQAATYYLMQKGIKELRGYRNFMPSALRGIYGDKKANEAYICRSLAIFTLYLKLRAIYGESCDLFTKSELADPSYGMFLRPLPDASIVLKAPKRGHRKHFILLLCGETVFPVVHMRRIVQLITHLDSGKWEEEGIKRPTVLILFGNPRQQKFLQPRIAKAIRDAELDDPKIYLTSEKAIDSINKDNNAVWQLATDLDMFYSL